MTTCCQRVALGFVCLLPVFVSLANRFLAFVPTLPDLGTVISVWTH